MITLMTNNFFLSIFAAKSTFVYFCTLPTTPIAGKEEKNILLFFLVLKWFFRLSEFSRSRSKSVGEQQWTNLRAVLAWYARLRRIKRSVYNNKKTPTKINIFLETL